MHKYLVKLKEITFQDVIVEAENEEEAEEKGYDAMDDPEFGWDGDMHVMVASIEQLDDSGVIESENERGSKQDEPL